MVRGCIVALGLKRFAKGRKSVFEIILDDGTARLHCRWWNLPYMQNYFQQGDEVLVHGKPLSLKPRTIDHPETEVIEGDLENSIHLNRIAPVYPLTEGLPQRWLRALVWGALKSFSDQIIEPWPPEQVTGFLSRADAILNIHFPGEMAKAADARKRLALDELIELQLAIQARRKALLSKARGLPCPGDNRLIKPFLTQLGFHLTGAQTKVLREIRHDMSSGQPMRRLLQGDVGSGKTVVAACCSLMAIESGFNTALMAPTEILAEQHFQTFSRWFEPLGIRVFLQTGTYKGASNPSDASLSLGGSLDLSTESFSSAQALGIPANTRRRSLVIGTHALIGSSFSIDNLGLVVIDEQHRFGVAQREQLVKKGDYPHLLVMTATPIPRTLGLTLYGDLDISVINDVPPGRRPCRTFVRTAEKLAKVWEFVRSKLAEGRQVFVVYPRIEDTGEGVNAVKEQFEVLRKELAPYRVAMLHGRLNPRDKDEIMSAFRSRTVQVLLSTSVVEVGIDVPNASVMLIENAEQFGLAQLHQLRGRIGRGVHESYCILITRAKTLEAKRRLQVLAETHDGFRIAEEDLKLRGPGDLLGQQQSGLPPLVFADLAEDISLVERARGIAAEILAKSGLGFCASAAKLEQ
jgi:ATP-dependent DNA helicase RecG